MGFLTQLSGLHTGELRGWESPPFGCSDSYAREELLWILANASCHLPHIHNSLEAVL